MLRKTAIACGVALLTLGVLDGVLRVWTNSPIYQIALPSIPLLSRYHANASADELVVGDLGRATPAVDDDEPRWIRTQIDTFGFRNDKGAATGPVDLIVLGDSFGFGVGTSQDAILASRLRDRYGRSPYNLSMPWTGPWAQFMNLSVEAPRLMIQPGGTLIWLLFTGNDLDDRYGDLDPDRLPRTGPAGRLWISAKRIRNRSPLYQMLRRAGRNLIAEPQDLLTMVEARPFLNGRTLLYLTPYTQSGKRTYEDVVQHPNHAALARTVAATKALAARLGLTLKIVLAPAKEEVYSWATEGGAPWSTPATPSGLSMALERICADAAVDFLDLKPSFVAASKEHFDRSGELLWWYDDTHWNGAGHDLAATIIHDRLLARAAAEEKRP